MNKATMAGFIVAITGFVTFLYLFTSGTHMPIYLWPNEALQGLAFSFAWGLGVPSYLAYPLAIILMAGVFYGFYRLGKRVTQLLLR